MMDADARRAAEERLRDRAWDEHVVDLLCDFALLAGPALEEARTYFNPEVGRYRGLSREDVLPGVWEALAAYDALLEEVNR